MTCVMLKVFLLNLEKISISEVDEVSKMCWRFVHSPNRHLVGGELLYINSKRKESNNLSKLNEEADFLGLLSLVMVQ